MDLESNRNLSERKQLEYRMWHTFEHVTPQNLGGTEARDSIHSLWPCCFRSWMRAAPPPPGGTLHMRIGGTLHMRKRPPPRATREP